MLPIAATIMEGLETQYQDFPGGPVVKTPSSQCRGTGSIPGQGTKIPHLHSVAKKYIKNKNMVSAVCFPTSQGKKSEPD